MNEMRRNDDDVLVTVWSLLVIGVIRFSWVVPMLFGFPDEPAGDADRDADQQFGHAPGGFSGYF